MSDVRKLDLLKQGQKLFGQVRPETPMGVSNNLTLARYVAPTLEHMLLSALTVCSSGFPLPS